MDKFESQFSDLEVQTSIMDDAISTTTAVSTPQDQVDLLMQQMADEAKVELQQKVGEPDLVGKVPDLNGKEKVVQEDDKLAERLRALRPAS
jgi:charged multivesicular body protein 1